MRFDLDGYNFQPPCYGSAFKTMTRCKDVTFVICPEDAASFIRIYISMYTIFWKNIL